MLLAGPNSKIFEVQIMQYVSLLARELCIRNYFLRLFVLDDTLKKARPLARRLWQRARRAAAALTPLAGEGAGAELRERPCEHTAHTQHAQ
jgi:hypothetical protein